MTTKTNTEAADKEKYKIPSWAGKPPQGTHLDVLKSSKLIQKLLIDEKGYYYFGRSPLACDFIVEHASCSRIHAVLLYHEILKRFAMVDLESSHGTFVENIRIESLTPVFLDFDNTFHFGASSRRYTLRISFTDLDLNENLKEGSSKSSLTTSLLNEFDVDNLTEYNTAQNRRIPQIPISIEEARRKSRFRPKLRFNDDEDIINPEDIDPSVGRFRNLVRTAVIPSTSFKRTRAPCTNNTEMSVLLALDGPIAKKIFGNETKSALSNQRTDSTNINALMSSPTLGMGLTLNAAPDLDLYANVPLPSKILSTSENMLQSIYYPADVKSSELRAADEQDVHAAANKKKYAKESWPGRKSNNVI